MIDLEHALADLAGHLDVPERTDAAATLRLRLVTDAPAVIKPRWRTRSLLVAAALLVIVATGVIAIAPARHAVADWLGIGAVEIRRSEGPALPAATGQHPVPGSVSSTTQVSPAAAERAAEQLASARRAVRFTIATPPSDKAGALAGVVVDNRVPGGLVALTYEQLTLVEIATNLTDSMPVGKSVGAADSVEHVTVNGEAGAWIPSPHLIGYLDRSGNYATDTVRRSGPVLLWTHGGVTYRIEGLHTQAGAVAVAATMR